MITTFLRSERVILVILCIGAVFGLTMIAYDTLDTWKSAPKDEQRFIITKTEAENAATQFLTEQFGIAFDSYRVTVSLVDVTTGASFLDQSSFSDAELSDYQNTYLPASVGYKVRFFKELEIEEYGVTLDAYRGNVVDFYRLLPENDIRTDRTVEEARAIARVFIVESRIAPVGAFSDLDVEETTLPGGKEYVFSFKLSGSEIPSSFGEGYARLVVTVQGDTIAGYYRDVFVPENFERHLTQESSASMLLGILSTLSWLCMIIAAFVVMVRMFIANDARWKLALGASVALFVLSLIDIVNGYPALFDWYSTDTSYGVFATTSVLLSVLFGAIGLLAFFIPAVAGVTEAFHNDRARLEPLTTLPSKGSSLREYSLALLRGYLIGIMVLGLTLAAYWLGERYLGVWYDLDMGTVDPTLLNFIPEFSTMLSLGFMAAITEELLFRLFGILVFRRMFGSTVLALIVATIVWAFAHSDGTVFPYWFRGLEVFVTGMIFAYFFIRYNILTTIIAHYVHNTIIGAITIVMTLGFSHTLPSLIMIFFPIFIVYGAYLYQTHARKRRGEKSHTEVTATL